MLGLAAALVLLAVVGWLLLPGLERSLIYFPSRVSPGYPPPDLQNADLEEFDLYPEDRVRITAWYAHTRNPRVGILYYLHGNGGSLYDRAHLVDGLAAHGFDVMTLDYRGYGKSAGTPSERGLYRDALAGLEHLRLKRAAPPERVVLLGKSLGSAIAIELAARQRFAGLVVESAFTSIRDVGRLAYPIIPWAVYDLLTHRYASVEKIGRVDTPLLAIHGTDDDLIPLDMGRRLFEAAREPKQWAEVPGGGHDDLPMIEGPVYYRRLVEFTRSLPTSPTSPE